MGIWAILVNLLFPIPLVMLLLLSIPLPVSFKRPIRSAIISFIDAVIFFKVIGNVTIYQLATLMSLVAFGVTAHETYQSHDVKRLPMFRDKEHDDRARCNRWRCERNFWISLLSLTLWLILFKMRSLTKELQAYRDRPVKID